MKESIETRLFQLRDEKYKAFQSRLIPGISPDTVIGVRTPELRKYAKELLRQEGLQDFLTDLPHKYFDENQLHAFIISEIKDFDLCMARVCLFLPYVDNWATCDQLTPKVFKKHSQQLLPYIRGWIDSGKTYQIRFAVKLLMEHFLDGNFDISYPGTVARIRSDEYYVNMMIAWYFATALAKQYDEILPFMENHRLSAWTHNKTIQKAIESYRIPPEQKEYLRGLKIRG